MASIGIMDAVALSLPDNITNIRYGWRCIIVVVAIKCFAVVAVVASIWEDNTRDAAGLAKPCSTGCADRYCQSQRIYACRQASDRKNGLLPDYARY